MAILAQESTILELILSLVRSLAETLEKNLVFAEERVDTLLDLAVDAIVDDLLLRARRACPLEANLHPMHDMRRAEE